MLISNEQIKKLSVDQYLQFLIEVYFKFYENQEILLAVANLRKENVFMTKVMQDLFNYTAVDNSGNTNFSSSYIKTVPEISNTLFQAIDYVIKHGKSCNCIIFDFYKGVFGGMNIRYDAIFKGEEVAGVVARSFNITKAYFEIDQHIKWKSSSTEKLKIEIDQINTLTPRQKQVLFLVLLDFSQERIANILLVTRGTVSRLITNICERLQLKFTSAAYLVEVIDKASIFGCIYSGDIPFKPLCLFINHEIDSFKGVWRADDF